MDQNDLQSEVTWRGAVPVSSRFDDPYFSLKDGLAETRYTFLDGNGLPARFVDGFHVAELGFGTGLNALATLEAWTVEGSFRFTSFEAYPMDARDMALALAQWPSLDSAGLVEAWGNGSRRFKIGPMEVEVIVGDVRETLPLWEGMADAWYLDGFSPSRNGEMWSQEVLCGVGRHTKKGGSFATYSAASRVRARLEAAGFQVTRRAGFGRKRHMSSGVL